MKTRSFPLLFALALSLGLAFAPAFARDESSLVLPTVPELRAQIATVKKDMHKLPADKKAQVGKAITRIETNLGTGSTYSVLSSDQQVAMVNDVSLIRSAMLNAEEERLVCKREKALGTNRISSICRTAGEWERLRQAARTGADDVLNHNQLQHTE